MNSHFESSDFRKWFNSTREESFIAGSHFFPDQHKNRPWLWMSTSGTTADKTTLPRWIAHTRQSLLNSAISVCKFLEVDAKDRWARILPLHHMGGLSLEVRAEVSGCRVLENAPQWDPHRTAEWMDSEKATLVSVVPTQVYDWVKNKISVPPSLRWVIVGADRLDQDLAIEARKLGWPVLASYGLTETASMIACQNKDTAANLNLSANGEDAFYLELLSHAEVTLSSAGLLLISCNSLFSAELNWQNSDQEYSLTEHRDLKGFRSWESSDFGEISNRKIKILGRAGDFVKVMGSFVNLAELDQKMKSLLKENHLEYSVVFTAIKDDRKGHQLQLVGEGTFESDMRQTLLSLWNQNSPGLHRAESFTAIDVLPRTELGKLKRRELMSAEFKSSIPN